MATSMNPMQYIEPVWLSSDAQIAALAEAYGSATLTTKLLGRYRFAPEVAHIRGVTMPWARVPLVFLAEGPLTVSGDRLAFASRPPTLPGWYVRGGLPQASFDLAPSEIESVEPADSRSPFSKIFDLPFTRVRTARHGLMGNFLLCVGGRVSVPKIRARSLELRRALEEFASGRRAGAATRAI